MQYTARFVDGKQSRAYTVQLSLQPGGLQILAAPDHPNQYWPYDDVAIVNPPHHGRHAVLTRSSDPDTRLTVEDDACYRTIHDHLPTRSKPLLSVSSAWRHIIIYGVIAIMVGTVIYRSVPELAKPIADNLPESWDRGLGDYVVRIMSNERRICDDPAGLEALETLAMKLGYAAAPYQHFNVQVVTSGKKEINAFAAPGGEIMLFNALITSAESPAEVAGVLAHEMGHVIYNHPTEGVVRGLGFYFLITALFGAGNGGDTALIANQLLELRHSRKAEKQADQEAVRVMQAVGKGPKGLISFFNKMMKLEEEHDLPNWMSYASTHPQTSKRIAYLESQPAPDTTTPPLLNDTQWQALQNICGNHSKPESAPQKLPRRVPSSE